ncbi:metal transporter, partial [Thermodesulfobacteriota bacterium]
MKGTPQEDDQPEKSTNVSLAPWSIGLDAARVTGLYWTGLGAYYRDFLLPAAKAWLYFQETERNNLPKESLEQTIRDYGRLFQRNLDLAQEAWDKPARRALEYHAAEFERFSSSLNDYLTGANGERLQAYMAELAATMHRLVIDFPEAIKDISKEYGFHFDSGGYAHVAQTDRMDLYQVLPSDPGVEVNEAGKPILIAHPYVLGSNILAFLPGEKRSYVHAFANQGIPTYVRIIKDISDHPPVQTMTGEDDALDTARFCRILMEKHGKPVTLNGVCQGGFLVLAGLLSGKLGGLVDALITCASPVDGTRSRGLREYLHSIAPRFRSLGYSTKTLPNGNRVVDGHVMSWVYKLKSLDREAPLAIFYRDMAMTGNLVRKGVKGISKMAAAVNRWLIYDRTDLPVEITKMSSLSYSEPISPDGELPVKLFGRALNLRYISDNNIRYLICYGARDDLVEPPSALAPRDFIAVEATEFPKGHAAILTSWSHPDSALKTCLKP